MSNKRKLSVIALVLVMALAVAGVSAYFTDADTATNTFTVGKISMDLQEPSWTEEPKDITPNEEFAKDPQIKNTGINAEYVFTTVSVPYANIKTADLDGTVNDAANTELFTLLKQDNTVGINAGWTQIGYLNDANEVSDTIVYRADGTVVHLYAYGSADAMTSLAADATTAPVFSKVRFVNAVEDQDLEATIKKIVIDAYAIQTDNINDTVGAGNEDGKTAPEDVWAVVYKQAPAKTNGPEEPFTDKQTPEGLPG